MRNLAVTQVKIAGMTGYQIQGLDRACSDSFWETIAHAAVFQDKARAERFLAKVKAKSSWNYDWSHWGVPVDQRAGAADAFKNNVAPFSVI
jgi:hypothetical protein